LPIRHLFRAYWPSILVLAAISLVCLGIFGGRRFINHVMSYDVDFSPATTTSTASSIGSLLHGEMAAQVGDMVFLNDVRLEALPQSHLFIVSGVNGAQMLVSLEAPKDFQTLPAAVDLRGTIRRLPGLRALQKTWKLTKDQARTFATQHIYLSAEYVKSQPENTTLNASEGAPPES